MGIHPARKEPRRVQGSGQTRSICAQFTAVQARIVTLLLMRSFFSKQTNSP